MPVAMAAYLVSAGLISVAYLQASALGIYVASLEASAVYSVVVKPSLFVMVFAVAIFVAYLPAPAV